MQCHHPPQTSQHTHFVACAWLHLPREHKVLTSFSESVSSLSIYTSLVLLRLNPCFVFLLFLCSFFLSLFFFFFFPVLSLFASLQPSFYCLLVPQPFGVLSVVVLPSNILFFTSSSIFFLSFSSICCIAASLVSTWAVLNFLSLFFFRLEGSSRI